MNNDYPLLDLLMGTYLNMDYGIIFNTDKVDGAIDYYVAENTNEQLSRLLKEIEKFELEHTNDLDAQFESVFAPDIVIDSVHDFFELVKSKIQKHLELST